MLAEGLEKLKLFVESQRCRIVDSNARRVRIFNQLSGGFETLEVEPSGDMVCSVDTLDSVAEAMLWFCGDEIDIASVWVSNDQVVCVLNDGHGQYRDRVIRMKYARSSVFESLCKCVDLSPKELAQKLRFDLFTAETTPSDLKDRVSALKFTFGKTSEHVNSAMNASVDKSVREAVTGANQVPEDVAFSFHPFPGLVADLNHKKVEVRCAVRVNVGNETVSILPYPDELMQAGLTGRQMIRAAILERVPSVEGSLFFGQPFA